MDLQLEGKRALVTGGAKGIGEAICRSLAKEGVHVCILDRDEAAAKQLVADLDTGATFQKVDLTDLEAVKSAAKATMDWADGKLDILVNNAGVNDGAGLEDGPEAFAASLQKNLLHAYAIVHHCIPALKRAKGSILNITSKVATTGQGNTSGYAASKGAINGLTREWALELAPHNVRVNAIAPAEVLTPLYKNWLATLDDPEETLKNIQAQIPLGRRMTEAQEIADLAVFTLSPRSAHTTGQILYPDGGYTHLDRACTSALFNS